MEIKITTNINDFLAKFNQVPQILHQEIIRGLSILGEKCVTRIRDRGADESWIDRTGNLRSSIGYAVYNDGKKVMSSAFATVVNGIAGTKAGREMINELASHYSQTYALVVVAGMDYAEEVEAMDNKDVLASTHLWAKTQVMEHLQKSVERAIKKINRL